MPYIVKVGEVRNGEDVYCVGDELPEGVGDEAMVEAGAVELCELAEPEAVVEPSEAEAPEELSEDEAPKPKSKAKGSRSRAVK